MSPTQTSPKGDLERLAAHGFTVTVENDVTTVEPIAYRSKNGGASAGRLVVPCALGPEESGRPSSHQAWWDGEPPCKVGGQLTRVYLNDEQRTWTAGVKTHHSFSHKPAEGYPDYYSLVRTYAKIIAEDGDLQWRPTTREAGEVRRIGESTLTQQETGLARIGLADLAAVYQEQRVSIVGTGGTGCFILDLVSKCPVRQIRIYDHDIIERHTALRWPGPTPPPEIYYGTPKSEYLALQYSKWHRDVKGYRQKVDRDSASRVATVSDCVFVAIDDGESRREIIEGIGAGTTVIDCGVDIARNTAGLVGTARVSRLQASDERREDVKARLPVERKENAEYRQNQQLAEMNALNACLAVLAWKESIGIYASWGAGEHRKYWTETNTSRNYEVRSEL